MTRKLGAYQAFGHEAKLISAKLVSAVRQNQKTDKNDTAETVHGMDVMAELPRMDLLRVTAVSAHAPQEAIDSHEAAT